MQQEYNFRFKKFCKLNNEQYLNFANSFYLEIEWRERQSEIVSSLKELNTVNIQAKYHNDTKDFLPIFIMISFPNLKNLTLNDLYLCNVQCLYLLQSPNLERLSLSRNKIINLRGLRKINFPNLSFIDLSGNQISQVNLISQFHPMQGLEITIDQSRAPNFRALTIPNPLILFNPLLKKHPWVQIELARTH